MRCKSFVANAALSDFSRSLDGSVNVERVPPIAHNKVIVIRPNGSRTLYKSKLVSLSLDPSNLVTCQWIRDANHLVIVGPTGTGKSWLACALGNKACRDGFSVLYKRTSRLFADLAQARGEGRLARLIAALERVNLLILDDWGPEPLAADQRRDLLEIVDDRYDKGSLLITSQVPVPQWHDVIADPTLGDAILDRIIHNAHRIELKGDSLRRQAGEKKKP